ncbi:hypothetical protein [Streptomyces sp. Inha503]|uniref:hypothetical protein n=1 Tax=Streptomyces sp. Inha503 TaxID=3383314 RepID=UPI0039A219AE
MSLCFAQVREGAEQLGEVAAGPQRDVAVSASAVEVREQELVPVAGEGGFGALPPSDGPLHARD